MSSTFLSLQIGVSALEATQMGVNTTGHNIANANTAGYARETTDVETVNSLETFTDHQNYLGQGTIARGQDRVVDESIISQDRTNTSQQQFWSSQSTEIGNLAQIFNEPTGTTLRQSLDGFFSAWNQLSQTPADNGARAAVYEASTTLADAFHTTAAAIQQNQTRYQTEATRATSDFNSLVTDIASLNKQILNASAAGSAPNDLVDQRDALLDKLSKYAGVTVNYSTIAGSPGTHITVTLNTKSTSAFGSSVTLLQDGNIVSQLSSSVASAVSPSAGTPGGTPNTVAISDLQDLSGSISSLYDLGNYSGNLLSQVNKMAYDFATGMDSIHQAGYGLNGTTGTALFNSASLTVANAASNIAVNSAITTSSLDLLAAATSPTTVAGANQTDGSNAANLANQLNTYEQGSATVQGYEPIVVQLGTDGQSANDRNQTFTALANQTSQMRQAVSGVNINEEMSNMVQFQQSYNAASKFVSVFNDMLNTLMQNV